MNILLTVLAAVAVAVADENPLSRTLNDGNNQFTAKVFTEIVKEKPQKSVVLSAFSVLPPLAQLALASVGESHDELLNAIGLKDDNTTKQAIALINTRIEKIQGITLKMANRIYIPKNRELNQDFAKVSRDVFQSEVKNVDFAKNVETAKEINSWVEDQTNHRIKDLVDPQSIDDSTRALLVNALYFKGKWSQNFDPKLTTDQDFHVNKETTIKVPTMHRQGTFKYGESKELNAKLLEMFYDKDEASFLVVLPNEVDGLAALEEKLQDPTVLPKALENMYSATVDVFLPKFKIETTTNLKDVLGKIGVKKLFSASQARLENLLKGSSDLFVSTAIQKAFIEVNEEGAEAAAANEYVPAGATALGKDTPTVLFFRANRPFYFEIKATNTRVNNIYQNVEPKLRLFSGVYLK